MGIFTVGMALVISVFPLALSYAASNTNKTCAAAAQADFTAQLKLLAGDISAAGFSSASFTPVADVFEATGTDLSASALLYPVDSSLSNSEKPFAIASIGQRIGATSDVRVIMFVCRRPSAVSRFVTNDLPFSEIEDDWTALPEAIECNFDNAALAVTAPLNVLKADTDKDWYSLLTVGALIVSDNGRVFKVEELLGDNMFRVDSFAENISTRNAMTKYWVVPASIGGVRSPVIAVYEAAVRFGS